MCVGEAALYGDLVVFLRDRCAQELAVARATSTETEAERLDRLIRDWFFTPQGQDLGGHAPRDYIRAEQLTGRGPVVPLNRLPDWLREEYEEMARYGVTLGADDIHIGYAPETTLLDAYDPEGAQALVSALEPCPICAATGLDLEPLDTDLPAEASAWLTNPTRQPAFVPTRFPDLSEAQDFVAQLYRLGATSVEVDQWHGANGPDALCVGLPADRRAAADLYTLWVTELALRQGLDPAAHLEPDELIFTWPRI